MSHWQKSLVKLTMVLGGNNIGLLENNCFKQTSI
jgi:hypothetical protein